MRAPATLAALLCSLVLALATACSDPDAGPSGLPPFPFPDGVSASGDGGLPPADYRLPADPNMPDIIAQVPCLDYDGVTDAASSANDKYVISPKVYAAHLDAIKKGGYTVLTMKQFATMTADANFPHNSWPARPMLLMSDTTSSWFPKYAAPLLRARGMTATVGVEVDLIGAQSWTMGPADLRALQLQGFEIASHSNSHADLTKVSAAQLAKEVASSKEQLGTLGLKVNNFIYPYGSHDATVRAAVKKAGYLSARATGAPTITGGGYSAINPQRRFSLNCALPVKTTTMAQLQAYLDNRHRLELEDLFVVQTDAGKLVTIQRTWTYKKASYGIVSLGDAGDMVSVTFMVTRPGAYDLELKVKTGIQGQATSTTGQYAYALNGRPLMYKTSGPYEVEMKYVVWGRHHIPALKLNPGWNTLSIRATHDWAALLDWLEISRR